MDSADLRNEIFDLAISYGACDVGFADVKDLNIHNMPKAVTVSVPLLKNVIEEITDKPTYDYYAHYRAVNNLIDFITLQIGVFISKSGYLAHTIAASQSIGDRYQFVSSFSHKIAATRSGMGSIGKNNLFMHDTYGSLIRLGTILTDAPFECGTPVETGNCRDCNICEKQCPASAIVGNEWTSRSKRSDLFDPRACSEYMKSYFSGITKGNACGICMKVCPKNKLK